jgi:putative tricarboxylic transport membrane protein
MSRMPYGRLIAAAAIALAPFFTSPASAQWKPTRDVEFVIPFAVGGGADLLARVIHKVITEEKLVPVPIALVNKPGGGGAVGVGYVAGSRRADPHTLVLVNGSVQITPILNPQVRTLSEIQPVMNVMLDDFVFFVKADSPWKNLADFAKDAKAKPAKTYAFATGGTTDVMAVTVLGKATGTELNTINFNSGGEALTALLGGHVHGTLGNPLEFMGHLNQKAVRAIAVFRDNRFTLLSDVPTAKEQGINAPNFQMWRGVGIPKGAPADAAKYWEDIMQKVVATNSFKAYLKDNAASEAPIAGAQFEAFLANQEKLYRELLGK